ncbi:DUF3501 family protein [Arenimonas fontis]|uniref:DUF3501 family protein n=1 Tax=Arenimonas fontis TaxID=2608255 RepID=A0A5B2Z8I8_9GAMM|nr:DUF3501 family protein [Arenimonas fontis]KAA2284195.1 DUF3501 family protein [Arenimonas fontis]
MKRLERGDLYPLELYAERRPAFRSRVLAHKRQRRLHLGAHVTLLFEDRLTVQYQVQEMLRIERIFEPAAIQEELDAYNPLIPDGDNLKATMLIEFPDIAVRRRELARLGGIEHRVYARVQDSPPVYAIADEDLPRSDQDKTAAVHFLRFEFTRAMIAALRNGDGLAFGIDDDRLRLHAEAGEDIRQALIADFD